MGAGMLPWDRVMRGAQNTHWGSPCHAAPWGLTLPWPTAAPRQLGKAARGGTRQKSCGWPLGLEGTSRVSKGDFWMLPIHGWCCFSTVPWGPQPWHCGPHRPTRPSQEPPHCTPVRLFPACQGPQPGSHYVLPATPFLKLHGHGLTLLSPLPSPLQGRFPVPDSEALPFHQEEAGPRPGRKEEET